MAADVHKILLMKHSASSPVPAPRSGHRCVADERDLYLFGGFSPFHSELIFRELWRFNLASKKWTILQTTGPAPTEVCSSCMLIDNGCIIIYGGSGVPFGASNSDKLHVYIIKENRWILVERIASVINFVIDGEDGEEEELPEGEAGVFFNFNRPLTIPIPGYGQSMALSPEKDLYIFSGTSGREFFNCVTKFQFSSRKWSCAPREEGPFVLPRYRHEAVTYGDRFYVIGGGLGSAIPAHVCQLDEVPSFCFATSKWELHKCLPSEQHGFPGRRRCHGCVLFGDKIYITGGTNGVDIYDDIWRLDLRTFLWEKLPFVLPYPVYFHSTAITKFGCLLTFGGMRTLDALQDPRSNDLSYLMLAQPTLIDLSWQVVLSCIPAINTVSDEELLRIGIPNHLIPVKYPQILKMLDNYPIQKSENPNPDASLSE